MSMHTRFHQSKLNKTIIQNLFFFIFPADGDRAAQEARRGEPQQVQGGGAQVRGGPHLQGDGQEVRDPPLHGVGLGEGVGEGGQMCQFRRFLPREG